METLGYIALSGAAIVMFFLAAFLVIGAICREIKKLKR